jgi:hypothetical protein
MKNRFYAMRAKELQDAFDRHDSRAMFNLGKLVDNPRTASAGTVKDANGILLVDPKEIEKRWIEHFNSLLNVEAVIELDVIEKLVQRPIIFELDQDIKLCEVKYALKQTKNCKAPGRDGIPADIWKYGGNSLHLELWSMICHVWETSVVPQDWKDAMVCTLFKKGDKTICGNYRGISLLSTAGKIMTRIIVNRTVMALESMLPEAQCGFRRNRSTVDMMYSARQIQEKCIEQNRPLYWCFVDLTKAYDTVHRGGLWIVLRKLGMPQKILGIIRGFHEGMNATLLLSGNESEKFNIKNGLRQGCVLAPNAFLLYLTAVLTEAFGDLQDSDEFKDGVWIRCRGGSGKLFNISGLLAKTRTSRHLLYSLLFADDMGICAHSENMLQNFMNKLSKACKAYGLSISLGKTEIMVQVPPTKGISLSDVDFAS